MIRGELKKIWKNRAFRWFLIVLFAVNIVQVYRGIPHGEPDSFTKGEQMIYEQVRGEWSDEKLRFIVENARRTEEIRMSGNYSTEPDQPGTYTGYLFGDCMVFNEYCEQMEYLYHYGREMQAVLDRAAENVSFYAENGNDKLRRENEQILRLYQNRSVPAFYRTDGAKRLISHDFSALLTVFAVLLCAVPVFARENGVQMDALLRTTPHGHAALALAKIAAAMLSAGIIALAFCLADVICFSAFSSIECFSLPLYAVKEFRDTPFSGTIAEYMVLLAFCRMLGAWLLTLICLLFSALLRSETAALAVSAAAVFVIMCMNGTWNPMLLFAFRSVTMRYAADSFFSVPVLHDISLMMMTVCFIIVLTVLIVLLSVQRFSFRRRRKQI